MGGEVRAGIKHVDDVEHGDKVLQDCKQSKIVVLQVNSFAPGLWQQIQRRGEAARLQE